MLERSKDPLHGRRQGRRLLGGLDGDEHTPAVAAVPVPEGGVASQKLGEPRVDRARDYDRVAHLLIGRRGPRRAKGVHIDEEHAPMGHVPIGGRSPLLRVVPGAGRRPSGDRGVHAVGDDEHALSAELVPVAQEGQRRGHAVGVSEAVLLSVARRDLQRLELDRLAVHRADEGEPPGEVGLEPLGARRPGGGPRVSPPRRMGSTSRSTHHKEQGGCRGAAGTWPRRRAARIRALREAAQASAHCRSRRFPRASRRPGSCASRSDLIGGSRTSCPSARSSFHSMTSHRHAWSAVRAAARTWSTLSPRRPVRPLPIVRSECGYLDRLGVGPVSRVERGFLVLPVRASPRVVPSGHVERRRRVHVGGRRRRGRGRGRRCARRRERRRRGRDGRLCSRTSFARSGTLFSRTLALGLRGKQATSAAARPGHRPRPPRRRVRGRVA